MYKYKIQQKISTPASCAVMTEGKEPASFEKEGVFFHIGILIIKTAGFLIVG